MDIDGVPLHVEVDGEGPPLLTVNGARCTVRQWDHAIDELSVRFTVVRHDVRGTGRSGPGPDDGYRFERYADDIVAVAEKLGFDRFALWGMAWGARVALVTAARHPEWISRLVLSDFAIDPADVEAQKEGGRGAKAARAAAGVTEVDPVPGAFDHDHPQAAASALAATLHHPDLMPFVEKVTAPTLIATGEHDPNLASSRRALVGFADARLEVLPMTGHGSVLTRPDTTTAVVLDFLGAERTR